MVFGPVDQYVPSWNKLNASSVNIYQLIDGSTKGEVPETQVPAFVDVRDVGEAHIRAYEVPEAAGQRFIVATGNYFFDEICDALRSAFPQLHDKIPVPKPGSKNPEVYKLSNQKARSVLGVSFRSIQECAVDTVKSLLALEEKLKA